MTHPFFAVYEGVEGIQEAYNLSLQLPAGSEILSYGTDEVEHSYPELIAKYLAQRIQKGITVRAILPDTPPNRQLTERNESELRQTRFLNAGEYPQCTEFNCFGDSLVYIAHSEKEPFATVLRSTTLSKEEAARFEILWAIASW
jgi:hypothetical protein